MIPMIPKLYQWRHREGDWGDEFPLQAILMIDFEIYLNRN